MASASKANPQQTSYILPPLPDELALYLAQFLTPRSLALFRRVSRRRKFCADAQLHETMERFKHLQGSTVLLQYFAIHKELTPADVVIIAEKHVKNGKSRVKAIHGASTDIGSSMVNYDLLGRLLAGMCILDTGERGREEVMWRAGETIEMPPGQSQTAAEATRLVNISRILRGYLTAYGNGRYIPNLFHGASLPAEKAATVFQLLMQTLSTTLSRPVMAHVKKGVVTGCIRLENFKPVWDTWKYSPEVLYTAEEKKYRTGQMIWKIAGKDARLQEELNYLWRSMPVDERDPHVQVDPRGRNPYKLPQMRVCGAKPGRRG